MSSLPFSMAKRRVFRDERLQRSFAEHGYVIVPTGDPSIVPVLRELYARRPSGITAGFYSSLHSDDAGYKAEANRRIVAVGGPSAGALLADYRPVAGNFVVKLPDGQGELPVHQDWTLVDESRFVSVNCWIPLMPINEGNGPLMVVDGSQDCFDVPRGSPHYPTPLDGLRDYIRDRCLTTLRPKVGEMVVHDHRLIHYSPANRSREPRIAVTLAMRPAEADLLHHYRDPDGRTLEFAIDEEFYSSFRIGDRPAYPVRREVRGFSGPAVTPAEFESRLRRRRPWWARLWPSVRR